MSTESRNSYDEDDKDFVPAAAMIRKKYSVTIVEHLDGRRGFS